MKTEISTYEAKTRLPELLRQVKAGKRFTITHRGKAIADLVPSRAAHAPDAQAVIEKFRAFMTDNPVKAQQAGTVKALIEEGRE